MLQIAIDCRWIANDTGGIKRYTLCLLDELLKMDAENQYLLITLKGTESLMEKYEAENSNVKLLKVGYGPFSLRSQFWLPIMLKKEKIDLLHSPNFMIPAIYVPFKTAVTVHDLIPYLHPEFNYNSLKTKFYFIYKMIMKRILKKADSIIVVSRWTKSDVAKAFPQYKEKIKVVYNGYSPGKPKKDSDKTDIHKKYGIHKNYLLYIGRQDPSKNIIGLIKAFYELKGTLNNYSLVIAGKKDERYSRPYELVKELKLQEDVIFTGYIPEEELGSFYENAKVFVFPSLYEGFGLPPLEAMARGVPVVVSDRSSLPEVVGAAALTVNPLKPEAIAEAVLQIVSDEKLQNKLIKKGHERAKMFSWKRAAADTLDTYKKTSKK